MVVDDSAVVRGLMTRMLEADSSISVVASVGNGQAAVQSLSHYDIEVIVLDIEMPIMDGLTALPKLLQKDPDIQIIMSSTLTLKNADISLRAIEAGAADYIPKPSTSKEITGGLDFKRDLVEKVKALGAVRRAPKRRRPGVPSPAVPLGERSKVPAARVPFTSSASGAGPATPAAPSAIILRKPSDQIPEVIGIGSSTGGPQALFKLLAAMHNGGGITQPIVITQHMPATFTTILAQHIQRISGREATEAQDGETLRGGHIYVAPGDFHMVIESRGSEKVIRINKNPPENFCRPSVDPMFRSLAKVFGSHVLAVVLTGMGSDGAKGGQEIYKAGGTVLAQDEASSVVWGMPGATAQAGICAAVLPLDEIAAFIKKLATRR
ncbi:MAG: chemotaxis response regulator protein-glutamate methylesterase [Alphaproteobacteria bacterium]|nr:chemotaxis response regulator protein-glutamate methylesterase [Alphaproteobacteria bacterium]